MSLNLQSLHSSLKQDDGQEIRVEVNQRHLIDKILARYSAENTIFRELLQNSNDACAENIVIEFNTKVQQGLSSLWTKVHAESVVYKNNGKAFSPDDFSRLCKIAEGNPDETKIGFFGVGFYSLFSICEEPFITSGHQTMAFLWRKDMLYTKRGQLPAESQSEWTTFYLPCREPIPVPDMPEFARFIATSLAFATQIKTVQVLIDSKEVLSFNRKSSSPKPLEITDSASYTFKSPNDLFKLKAINISKVQVNFLLIIA